MSEPNFYDYLAADSALGAELDERIYPDMAPEGTAFPVLVFQRLGGRRDSSYCGTNPVVLGNYQFNIYARSRLETRTLGDLVRDLLLDFRGQMGDVRVALCALAGDFDSIDPDPGLLCRTQLWDVWYVER
jgi:hypothetical protein